MVNAWHLRQDGKFFPVQVHLYAMGDGDLSSEAEVAAFLLKTNSEDKRLARRVIDFCYFFFCITVFRRIVDCYLCGFYLCVFLHMNISCFSDDGIVAINAIYAPKVILA